MFGLWDSEMETDSGEPDLLDRTPMRNMEARIARKISQRKIWGEVVLY